MRLVMCVRISRCPEYQSSYLPFEENHAQTKCANLTTETVFKSNVYVTLNAIGSFQCNLCSHWLIQILVT